MGIEGFSGASIEKLPSRTIPNTDPDGVSVAPKGTPSQVQGAPETVLCQWVQDFRSTEHPKE